MSDWRTHLLHDFRHQLEGPAATHTSNLDIHVCDIWLYNLYIHGYLDGIWITYDDMVWWFIQPSYPSYLVSFSVNLIMKQHNLSNNTTIHIPSDISLINKHHVIRIEDYTVFETTLHWYTRGSSHCTAGGIRESESSCPYAYGIYYSMYIYIYTYMYMCKCKCIHM